MSDERHTAPRITYSGFVPFFMASTIHHSLKLSCIMTDGVFDRYTLEQGTTLCFVLLADTHASIPYPAA